MSPASLGSPLESPKPQQGKYQTLMQARETSRSSKEGSYLCSPEIRRDTLQRLKSEGQETQIKTKEIKANLRAGGQEPVPSQVPLGGVLPCRHNVNMMNTNKQVAFRLIYPQSLGGIVPLDKPLGL